MAFVVEMVAGEPDTQQFRYFCCNWTVWEQGLQLARKWGWQPLGTRPAPVWLNQPNERAEVGDSSPSGRCLPASPSDSSHRCSAKAIGHGSAHFPQCDTIPSCRPVRLDEEGRTCP
jgi:hypothetical protein